jgi:hypothetical protein
LLLSPARGGGFDGGQCFDFKPIAIPPQPAVSFFLGSGAPKVRSANGVKYGEVCHGYGIDIRGAS